MIACKVGLNQLQPMPRGSSLAKAWQKGDKKPSKWFKESMAPLYSTLEENCNIKLFRELPRIFPWTRFLVSVLHTKILSPWDGQTGGYISVNRWKPTTTEHKRIMGQHSFAHLSRAQNLGHPIEGHQQKCCTPTPSENSSPEPTLPVSVNHCETVPFLVGWHP